MLLHIVVAAIAPTGEATSGVVQLFKKPAVSTGKLVINDEGLNVLREQTAPFALVAAAGPTRTGKSSILDHAFIGNGSKNKGGLFDVGDGILSHTTGVWMTREPVTVSTPHGQLNVFVIDTEGFGGIGRYARSAPSIQLRVGPRPNDSARAPSLPSMHQQLLLVDP